MCSKESVSSLHSQTLRHSSTTSNSLPHCTMQSIFHLKEWPLCSATCIFPCCVSSSTLSTKTAQVSSLHFPFSMGIHMQGSRRLAVFFRISATCWILLSMSSTSSYTLLYKGSSLFLISSENRTRSPFFSAPMQSILLKLRRLLSSPPGHASYGIDAVRRR